MTTLTEYATTHFPHHVTDETPGDMTLTSHTVVAHVVGSADGMALAARVRAAVPDAEVGAVLVRPTTPTVANTGGEDPEGVVDLPRRRVAVSGITGAVMVGSLVGVVVGLVGGSVTMGVITGVFAAILAGAVTAIAGGGARYAGDRAWEQPQAPDRTIAVVAAFTRTEDEALVAARAMEDLDPFEVRIVSSDGAWHSPNT